MRTCNVIDGRRVPVVSPHTCDRPMGHKGPHCCPLCGEPWKADD